MKINNTFGPGFALHLQAGAIIKHLVLLKAAGQVSAAHRVGVLSRVRWMQNMEVRRDYCTSGYAF